MNIEDLKKLSTQDALKAAAEFAGVDASVFDGMWRTESARGTAMLSPAGARGHFGLMPKTQAAFEKKLGVKVNPDNFHESLFIAANHFKDDLQREGGNVVSALRAYNNGPQWRAQKDPRGENANYPGKVLGQGNTEAAPTKHTVSDAPPQRATLSTPMPFLEERESKPGPDVSQLVASLGFVAGMRIDPQTQDISGGFKKAAGEDLKAQQEIDNMSLLGAARSTFMHQGVIGGTLKRMARPEFEPTPGFVTPENMLGGYSADDQAELRSLGSQGEFEYRKWELDNEREDMRVAGLRGGWFAMGASVLAGLPEGAISGIGVAKSMAVAGLGSSAAIAAGQTGRAISLNVAENVGGNLAFTALEDAISGRMSVFDYAAAGVVGGVFSGVQAPGTARASGARQQAALSMRIAEDAARMQREIGEQASRNLGPSATSEELTREMDRLETIEVKRTIGASSVGEDRRLLPDMEKLEADEVEAQALREAEANKPAAKPEEQSVMFKASQNPAELKDANGNSSVLRTVMARDRLAEISANPGDPVLRLLAGRLMTAIGDADVPIYVMKTEDIARLGGKNNAGQAITRSHYTEAHHAIVLEEADDNVMRNWVITHEVAHAASVSKLRSLTREPNSEIAEIAGEIDSLRQLVQREWKAAGKTDQDGAYYLGSKEEFVAGLFSGRSQFTDFMKSVKVKDDLTVWNSFVDIMRRLLGIKDKEMDAFTKALNLSEELFSKPVTTTVRSVGEGSPITSVIVQAPLSPTQSTVAHKYGLDLMPVETAAQRAEQKALISLYEKADNPAATWNNIDPKWINTLTAKVPALGSTGLHMLRSKNPVARMVASELLESTTGAGGRRATGSIDKYMAERKYVGNAINDFQNSYTAWRNAQGVGRWDDYVGGKTWERFNREVAEEFELRRTGAASNKAPAVKKAADVMEAGYERMRIDQVDKKTTGWGALPTSSKGYMPHRISGERVRNMTIAQANAFQSALVDQFVSIEGWDFSFASNLAAKYIDRAKVRATGGHDIPVNVHHTGAADVVKDALQAMGMSQPEIQAQMAKYRRGGPTHTKQRLRLDLLQEFDDNGRTFTLMDLFETDQLTLMRGQAGRVSGEVALAKHGVMGKEGMRLLRRAMTDFGADNGKAQPVDWEAFDQIAAEFLNEPFGDYGGKWMNRAMQANSLARLGGMGFTQFAEYINAATHLGVAKAFKAASGMPRLRAEAAALARGEKVDNPIIGSIEVYGGAEFGTDSYKMVFPFDNQTLQYQVNGHDTLALGDRLLRAGGQAQAMLSGWRAIHSAQQRGVAEQIVHKAVKFIRDGGNDKALADMGIDAELADRLRADLPAMARFDANGNLAQFDITKTENRQAADAFTQAIHRGTGQIIQGTFIGETGKWAHSGWLRLMTQFRTFSITSVEKQWARNRNNYGVAASMMMLMGAMSAAAPIYMARTYLASVGRPDQEEYLEKQLSYGKIARATLNYVAASGLAGDFVDGFAAVTGATEATGGRTGSPTGFVGTVIAPAAGLADDVWAAVQNSKDGTDVHGLVKTLPFANLPYLKPAINLMDD